MTADNNIVSTVDGKFSGRSFIHLTAGDWADLRAEIVRLRGEVDEAKEGEAACLRAVMFYEQERIKNTPQPAGGEAVAKNKWAPPYPDAAKDPFNALLTTPPAAQVQLITRDEAIADFRARGAHVQQEDILNAIGYLRLDGSPEALDHIATIQRLATHPAAGDKVRELVEKWRPHGRVPVCELEAALAQPQEADRG